jgi:hypothetical protein
MEKRPTDEQLAKYRKNAQDQSLSAEVRAKFQAVVDKFSAEIKELEGEKPKSKRGRKPSATAKKSTASKTKKSADDIETAKAEIKRKTGKTEEECESIIEQYRALRTKAQEGRRKAEQASAENKKRVQKLDKKGDLIEGTSEKTADAVIESATKDVAEKIEKQIEAVEDKAEKEAKAEVAKDKTLKTPKAKKEAVEAKVEKKVAEKTKTIVKRVVIDTSELLTSIATSLGKFDKDSQKEFLIKLRSDIDKLLSKYAFGGMTDGATQVMNIQQSNLSSSSVNPSQFGKGGGVSSYGKGGRMFGEDARLEYVDDAFASEDLKDELREKLGIEGNSLGDNVVISFAYTDYGGDFLDKVAIRYFEENYPENIVVENAGYNGQNAYVFGEPAQEWIDTTDDYPLGFENIEDLYYEMQNEAEYESYEYFLDDLKRDDYVFDKDEVMDWLMENKGGYYSMTTQGLDFSYSDLTDELVNEGLIKKEEEEYKTGGQIGKELMGGQSNSTLKPSGAILLKVIGNGREIIVTEDGGKTKERYVRRKGGFSGYALHYNGYQYEFTDSFAKGGMTEHGLRVGDEIVRDYGQFGFDEVQVRDGYNKNYVVNLDKGIRSKAFGKGGAIKEGDILTANTGVKLKVVNYDPSFGGRVKVIRIDEYGDGKISQWMPLSRFKTTKKSHAKGGGVGSMLRNRRGQ